MATDTFFAERLRILEGIPDYPTAFSDPAMTARLERYAEPAAIWTLPAGVTCQSHTLDGLHGPFEVRIYTPDRSPSGGLLWLHGGGWMGGSLDMPEGHIVAAELARRANVVVVSVGYHLATPELKYPAPLDDVVTAWEWFSSRDATLGIVGNIAIGGASAGGSLAMAAAMRLRDEGGQVPSQMLLAYPLVHFPVPALPQWLAEEMSRLPQLIRFDHEKIAYLQSGYVGRLSDLPVYSAPGHGKLRGMPAASIIISEYDDLRPSADLLITQLHEARVTVSAHLAKGMVHGHLNWAPGDYLPEVGRSLDFFATALATRSSS